MTVEKTLAAVAAGHICLDIRYRFEDLEAILKKIQPGAEFNPSIHLYRIQNDFDVTSAPMMAELIKRAGALDLLSTGGGVSNTGIPLSYLFNGNVALMAKVGKDSIADAIEEFLNEKAGCQVSLKRVRGQTTSYTLVLTDERGNTMLAHNPGTNDTFGPDDIDYGLVAQARMFEFSYPPLMERFYTDDSALASVFRTVSKRGTKSFLDMHVLDETVPSGQANWTTILGNALPHIDMFCPSLGEALYIVDRGLLDRLFTETLVDSKAPEGECQELLDVAADKGALLAKISDFYFELGARAVMINVVNMACI